MSEVQETDDADDFKTNTDQALEAVKNEVLEQTPLEKQEEIKARFNRLFQNIDSFGEEGILLAVQQIKEVVTFYTESIETLEKDFSSQTSSEIVQLIRDSFISGCDLETNTVSEINEQRQKIEQHFQQLIKTKEKIEGITHDSTIEKWFLDLVKDWKKERKDYQQIENELLSFLQERQEDDKKKEIVLEKINNGLLNQSEKRKWNQNINQKFGSELQKSIKEIERILTQREKKLPELYAKKVTQNLDKPLKAREELRKLRAKFGWGIFDFLEANELWQKLNTIHILQRQKAKIERDLRKTKEETKTLEQELQAVENELSTLTEKPKPVAIDNVIPIASKEKENETQEKQEKNESQEAREIEVQIESLEKVKKIINTYWLPGALQAKAIQKEGTEGIDLFEKPESHAWLSGDGKVNWLKTHTDKEGENLWEKYKRLESGCPYSVPQDKLAHTETFYPRYINLPLDDFDSEKAKVLDSTLDTYLQGPKELIFLAGAFFINPQKDKLTYASAPAEVLSKIQYRITQLEIQKINASKSEVSSFREAA